MFCHSPHIKYTSLLQNTPLAPLAGTEPIKKCSPYFLSWQMDDHSKPVLSWLRHVWAHLKVRVNFFAELVILSMQKDKVAISCNIIPPLPAVDFASSWQSQRACWNACK